MKRVLVVLAVLFFMGFAGTAFAQQGTPQAVLTWAAPTVPTPAQLSYRVERSTTQNGTYASVATPTTTNYTDTAVTRGQTYFYHVFSVCPATGNGCGTAAAPMNGSSTTFLAGSGTIPNASTVPPAPTNLSITVQ